MLLKNFSGYCRANATGCKAFDGSAAVLSTTGVGVLTNFAASYYSVNVAGQYVDVEFSDTAVQNTDYKLGDSNAIDTPTLTYVSCMILNDMPYIRSAITVFRNDTSSAVTVKEVGLVTKSNAVSNPAKNMLLSRVVLPTPVVIQPGDTYAFTFTIEI